MVSVVLPVTSRLVEVAFMRVKLLIVEVAPFTCKGPQTYKVLVVAFTSVVLAVTSRFVEVAFTSVRLLMVEEAAFTTRPPVEST